MHSNAPVELDLLRLQLASDIARISCIISLTNLYQRLSGTPSEIPRIIKLRHTDTSSPNFCAGARLLQRNDRLPVGHVIYWKTLRFQTGNNSRAYLQVLWFGVWICRTISVCVLEKLQRMDPQPQVHGQIASRERGGWQSGCLLCVYMVPWNQKNWLR